MPIRDDADELRLGMLAIQTGLVAPESVLAAARAPRPDDESLDKTLIRLGALMPEEQTILQSLNERLAARKLSSRPLAWSPELEQALTDSLAPIAAGEPHAAGATADSIADFIRRIGSPPTDSQSQPSGRRASRFRIIRLHARGGLGQVSLAIDEELRREVALKEIREPYARDPECLLRFEREARITGSLEHPGIVPVYGLGLSDNGRPYYAMRFIQGRSMKEALEEYHGARALKSTEAPMMFRDLLRRFIDMCNAVEYAHSRGVIHRDLKPDNVMLGPYGETLVVDWGLAKQENQPEDVVLAEPPTPPPPSATDSNLETRHGLALGTPSYMSPEQARGDWKSVGPRSDVYSLGATLYHLLAGESAFWHADVSELIRQVREGDFPRPRAALPSIPPALEAICLKAMALRPADRYASARQLAGEIEHWLADEPVAGYREGFGERWFRRMRRHRNSTMAAAVTLPLLLIVTTAAAIWVDGARREALRQKEASDLAKEAEAEQKRIAVAATHDARRRLVDLQMATGERLESEGDLSAAMLWYVKTLPLLDPNNPAEVHAHRLRLALIYRQLPRLVSAWTLPASQRARVARQFASPDGSMVVFTGNMVVGVNTETGRPLWPPLPYAPHDIIPWASFSPDGSRIIVPSGKGNFRIWDARTGGPLTATLETAHDIPLVGTGAEGKAEFSADNRSLVIVTTSAAGRAVEVWDLSASKHRFAPLEFPQKISAACFSPDGRQLLVGTDTEAKFYDVADGKPSGTPIAVPGLWNAAYSPDGKWLATASGEGHAQIWDAAARKPVGPALAHRGPVTRVVFSPDSKQLLTLGADQTARLWEVATGQPVGQALEHADRPFTGSFSPDGRRVVTVTMNHTVHVWDAATGRQITAPLRHATEPAVSAAEHRLLVAVEGRGAQWDTSRSAEPADLTLEGPGIEAIGRLSFSPDGTTLAATAGPWVWLLDASSGAVRRGPPAHDGPVRATAFSPDGRLLATAGDDGAAQLWNLAEGKPHAPPLKHAKPIVAVRFDGTGRRLLTASEDHTARIWDVATGAPIGDPIAHKAPVRDADFSPDGLWVVTGSDDGSARISGTADGKPRPGDESHIDIIPPQSIVRVRFHPAGQALLAATSTGTIHVWNPFDPAAKVATFRLQGAGVNSASFSPDGRFLLAAGISSAIHVWNWRSHESPPVVLPVVSAAFDAQFSSDSVVVAASSFGGVQLWEADGGRPIGPRLGPLARALAFSPDGRQLVGAADSLRWWHLAPDEHPADDLEKLAILSAQREINARGNLQFLSAERIEALQLELSYKLPDDFKPAPTHTVKFAPAND